MKTVTVLGAALMGIALTAPAHAYEHSLAGVMIGEKGVLALHRYGNPTYVAPGLGKIVNGPQLGAGGVAGGPYGMQGGPYGMQGGPYGMKGGPYGMQGGPYGMKGGPYGASSYGYPKTEGGGPSAYGYGSQGPGALPPAYGTSSNGLSSDNSSSDVTDETKDLITWTYKKPGVRLDFRLDEDGHVVEIVATGTKPVPYVQTARGIRLGDTYGKVLLRYGPPENTREDGDVITVSYQNSQHVAFQFVKTKLARIDVAEVKTAKKVQ